MTHPNITLDQVHVYFAERVFDSFEPGKANALYQIAAPSDASPKPSNTRNNISMNISPSPRMCNKLPFMSYEIGWSQQRNQASSSRAIAESQQRPYGYSPNEREIPIRAFNPAVPILRGPRIPPPRGTPYAGSGPRAEGNRCIGCGITGHSTYDCPYGNYPFCYRCKRFGHKRAECRDEWLADLPGDQPMQSPPSLPPNPPSQARRAQLQQQIPGPNQQLAIEQSPTSNANGNFLRLSCFSGEEPNENVFLLDTGASTHVVRDASFFSNFTPYTENRHFFTAQGSSVITIQGRGEIIIRCATRTFTIFLKLKNMLFAPHIPVNVISVSQLCIDNCVSVVFSNSTAIFYRSELIDPKLSDPVPRTSTYEMPLENISSESESALPSDDKLRSEYKYTVNFSKPFFSVPKTRDNLYSFKLSSYTCPFDNICLTSSPIYVLNEDIPQGTCQAVLLKVTKQPIDTTSQHHPDDKPIARKVEIQQGMSI